MKLIKSFSRKPYTVQYKDFHTGELVSTKRRPPAKLHDILPTDIVEIKSSKNQDWQAEDEHKVKHISYRAPNLVQLTNDEGMTTFFPSYELNLVEEIAYRKNKDPLDDVDSNRYLRWP